MKIRTWNMELGFASLVMFGQFFSIAYLRGHVDWREILGIFAVLILFAHGQVADRLSEREGERAKSGDPTVVECYKKEFYYFIGKEVCWAAYFISMGAWSALVGTLLLFSYRPWRKWWRTRYPLDRNQAS